MANQVVQPASRSRLRLNDTAGVVLLFVALTFVMAYPLSITADRTLPADDPDGHLFMWTIAWDVHAFVHQPLSIFDANIFLPYSNTLAYSENLIGSALFAAPVLWLTDNPVLAVNAVSLLSCILCGIGAYALGRALRLSVGASVLTGLIFAFSPPRFFRFSQLHLAAVQWIPFALAAAHSYLEHGRRRDLRLALAFFSLQALASGHGAVFLAVAAALLVAYAVALGEPISFKRRIRDCGIAGAALLMPAVLMVIPYRISQVDAGLRRPLDTTPTPIESFFASPTGVDMFLQSLVTDRHINDAATAWLFPGVLPVALASIAFVFWMATIFRHSGQTAPNVRSDVSMSAGVSYKRPLVVILVAALSCGLLGSVPALRRASNGVTAQPYSSDKIVWNGYLTVVGEGRYAFGVHPDEDARLTIDNRVIIDHKAGVSGTPTTGSAPLTPGSHRFLLEQPPSAGRTAPDFLWGLERARTTYEPVPSWALSRRPVNRAVVMALRGVEWARLVSAAIVALSAVWLASLWVTRNREARTVRGAGPRPHPVALYLVLTFVCIGLAAGASGLWQYVYWLPGFNFIRAPSRFMVLGLLAVAVLAGVGFDALGKRLPSGSRRIAAVVVGLLLLTEFCAIPYSGVPYRFEFLPADLWVARQPKPFAIAEVPVTRSERYHSNYMLHSMAHWQKTVHGYSGIRPALHEQLYDRLEAFPSADSIQQLADLGVTYVIVHSSWFTPPDRQAVEERLADFDASLELRYSDAESRVYAIRANLKAPR